MTRGVQRVAARNLQVGDLISRSKTGPFAEVRSIRGHGLTLTIHVWARCGLAYSDYASQLRPSVLTRYWRLED